MPEPILRIDARTSAPLRDLVIAIKKTETGVRRSIRQQSKRVIEPEWRKVLAERASTRLEQRMIVDTARVSISDQNVSLRSGAVRGRMRRFDPRDPGNFYAVEGGSEREKFSTYKRKGSTVKRRTRRGLKLPRSRGYVAGPAARGLLVRAFRLWAQTAVREIAESLEEVSS